MLGCENMASITSGLQIVNAAPALQSVSSALDLILVGVRRCVLQEEPLSP